MMQGLHSNRQVKITTQILASLGKCVCNAANLDREVVPGTAHPSKEQCLTFVKAKFKVRK